MPQILTPPDYADKLEGPLVFLAGPIRGARDWQSWAIEILTKTDPLLNIASPRRPGGNKKFVNNDGEEQTTWEHYHMERTLPDGVILFFLAKETTHYCDGAYAQTSRFELAWKFCEHRFLGTQIVIGIEPGFSNRHYIRETISEHAPHIPIRETLAATCAETIRLVLDRRKNGIKVELRIGITTCHPSETKRYLFSKQTSLKNIPPDGSPVNLISEAWSPNSSIWKTYFDPLAGQHVVILDDLSLLLNDSTDISLFSALKRTWDHCKEVHLTQSIA